MQAGKLIHTATLYKEEYVKNNDGTNTSKLMYVKKIKCSIRDVSYQNKEVGNKDTLDTNIKIITHYFNDHNINMLVKINSTGDKTLYKTTYIENVEYKNRVLIFSLAKYEGSINV